MLLKVLVAIAALAGTILQMYQSTREIGRFGSKVRDAVALEGLRSEIKFIKHPIRWSRRQQEVWLLLQQPGADDYITELRATYVHIWLHVTGWTLLMLAALGATLLAFSDS